MAIYHQVPEKGRRPFFTYQEEHDIGKPSRRKWGRQRLINSARHAAPRQAREACGALRAPYGRLGCARTGCVLPCAVIGVLRTALFRSGKVKQDRTPSPLSPLARNFGKISPARNVPDAWISASGEAMEAASHAAARCSECNSALARVSSDLTPGRGQPGALSQRFHTAQAETDLRRVVLLVGLGLFYSTWAQIEDTDPRQVLSAHGVGLLPALLVPPAGFVTREEVPQAQRTPVPGGSGAQPT